MITLPVNHLRRRFKASARLVDLMRRTVLGVARDEELAELQERVGRLREAIDRHKGRTDKKG